MVSIGFLNRYRLSATLVLILLSTSSLPLLVSLVPTVLAQNPSCGDTITTDTTLSANIGPCSGNGLVIEANGITLNCAGHTISGSFADSGIYMTGHTGVKVKNCNSTNFANGFYLLLSNSSTFTSNTANNDSAGFNINNSTHDAFTKNRANKDGLGIGSVSSSHNTFSMNAADHDGLGISLENSSSNTLTLNDANNDGLGIGLGWVCLPVCGASFDNTVTKNTADNNYVGFNLTGSFKSTFVGNTANNNKYGGFGLTESSNDILSGNKANSNGYDGFSLDFNAFSNTITKNTANDNQVGYVLNDTARANTLTMNTANNNKQYGFYDGSSGSGTKGTANNYMSNVCKGNKKGGSSPSGLGSPQQ